ncbi:MAG: hypothetical protein PHG19_06000 [Anaerotignum sp.]|nr:hypothetical protein [Anaerotignum sp.]
MARITFTGLSEYMEKIQRLGMNAEEIAGKAIYEAAGILANEVKSGINGLDAEGDGNVTADETERRKKQKDGLKDGFGIAVIRNDNGFINVLVGFGGYNDVRTPKFKNGQPNQMVARIFNSGTSHNRKQPFFDNAVKLSRKRVQLKMKEIFENEIENIMRE